MSGGGSSGTTTSVQRADPWVQQQPFLSGLYQRAWNLPEQQFFPGSTVVPQSPETLQALDLATARATGGSPLQTAGQDELQSTLQGNYLYGGPGFDAAFDAAQRRITPAVQGQFERAGRFGGGLAQEAETQALADAFAGLYDRERQRQIGSISMVPGMAGLDYADIGQLARVGGEREAFDREQLSDELARWEFGQNAPYQRVGAQSAIIQGGFPGGTTTSQVPYYRNQMGGALGGGLAGLGLAQGLGQAFPALGGPWGLAAGAGLGILGGLLG